MDKEEALVVDHMSTPILEYFAEQQKKLHQPTPERLKKTRPGGGGITLTYVPGKEVVKELIEIFDNIFEWDVKDVKAFGNKVVCIGTLKALVVGKSGISKVVKKDGVGEADAHGLQSGAGIAGDPFKSAETDALKRAAEKFGLHLDLSTESMALPEQIEELMSLLETALDSGKITEAARDTTKALIESGITSVKATDLIARITKIIGE